MKKFLRSRLDRHFGAASALVAAAAVGGPISAASATVIYSGVVNLPVANNVNGIYLNLATGVHNDAAGSTGASAVPGWDINIYFGVDFYGSGNPGYAYVAGTGGVAALPPGATIGPSNCTTTGTSGSTGFTPGVTGLYYGFKFQNEAMGNALQYGWAQYEQGVGGGPGTLIDYAYEDSGNSIVAGDVGNSPGACCMSDGSCSDGLTYAACTAAGGSSFVVNSTCAAAGCPAPGACCKADGTCSFGLPSACTAAGGTFSGGGVTCAQANCPQPGACCAANGTCTMVQPSGCTAAGSTFGGAGTTCGGSTCPTGACCFSDGTCATVTSAACTTQGGTFNAGTTCATHVCPGGYAINCGTNVPGTFTDISSTGSPVAIGYGTVDDGSGTITTVAGNALVPPGTALYPCTNGFISNLSTFTTFTNGTLPYTAISGFTLALYPNWDDLYMSLTTSPFGSIMYQHLTENGVGVDVIEWVNARPYVNETGPSGNFEVKIFSPPGGPGGALVQYVYQDMSWDFNGNSSTVGVQWSATAAAAAAGLNGNGTSSGTGPLANNSVCSILGATSTPTCYANCDHSTGTPFLNVADFTCFLQKFATGDPYANCDGSTSNPTLNVGDFTCFLQKFAIGCSAP